MKIAIQVPVKAKSSTRVPNKNFRTLCGKPFAWWVLDRLVESAPAEWDIFIDSESDSVMEKLSEKQRGRVKFFLRDPWFAEDHANGNHLLHQFAVREPGYDLYAQLFVTAVTLPGEIIREAVQCLATSVSDYDSLFLVTEETGWFWFKGEALNYRPDIPNGLPRSQDAMVCKETTGLYAITRDALLRTGCRIGNRPYFYKIPPEYAFDVDTMEDFRRAEKLISEGGPGNG